MILITLPVMVVLLLRLNRQYDAGGRTSSTATSPPRSRRPILRRHVVLVFIDRLDMATARAIQYARSLTPDELRVVHFAVDDQVARELAEEWRRLGLTRVPLDIVGCPDRRLTRAAVQLVARELADGETEVSVLLPDRKYRGAVAPGAARPHGRGVPGRPLPTAARQRHHGALPARRPFGALDRRRLERCCERWPVTAGASSTGPTNPVPRRSSTRCHPIIEARWRDQVRVAGEVRSVRIVSQHDSPTLELVLVDGTGALSIVFLGRRQIAGVEVGTRLEASGTVGVFRNRLAMLNPTYKLLGVSRSATMSPARPHRQPGVSLLETPLRSGAMTALDIDLEHELKAHRRELTGYCYRMLGSGAEAEDAVQETLVRAWKAIDRFEGRSSVRSWLYRIASNVCIDMLRAPQRRARPMDLGPSSTVETAVLAPQPENTFVQPIADDRVIDIDGDPAEVAAARESIRLAFVAALQHLPARQRAVLILCEVLKWQATEVAELLETSVASVNSALQRARATLAVARARPARHHASTRSTRRCWPATSTPSSATT